MRILLATAESHPTYRPDVQVLFGQALPAHGIQVDLLAVTPRPATAPWPGGVLHAHQPDGRGAMAALVSELTQKAGLLGNGRLGPGLQGPGLKGVDLLVVRDKPVLGLIGWLAARQAGIPFAYWMSYPLPAHHRWLAQRTDLPLMRRVWMGSRGRLGQSSLDHVLVPRSDWLFVQSQAMLESLRPIGLPQERVSVVPMGVDVAALPAPATDWPSSLQGRSVGVYLGTLDRARGLEVLIDATLRVVRQRPDFRLLVIGEADEPRDVGALQEFARLRGASPWVHFAGRMPRARALSWVRRCALALSPVPRTPLTEVGSPTKAIEALACGIPVVCNDQPDQAAVIRGSQGGHVVDLSSTGFAQGVLRTLREIEAGHWLERSRVAREWVRRHRDYQAIGARVAVDLQTCVSRHAQRRMQERAAR
ncbi:MAG: glycosyltransferase [Burkholderiales bacterium]